ncbi:MAG: hypothetical protein JWO10_1390 [Microbacteriaceae bacterium]|nr:hypothetical protein [Microbacteriaceae bacterium]
MTSSPDYDAGPLAYSKAQVELIESSGGTQGTISEGGEGVVVLTTRGAKSGEVRKAPVIRVAHGDSYCVIASLAGNPKNPQWYHNVMADPNVTLQDGPEIHQYTAREVSGDERTLWWGRAVEAYPTYDEYQSLTDRVIPVVVLEPAKN